MPATSALRPSSRTTPVRATRDTPPFISAIWYADTLVVCIVAPARQTRRAMNIRHANVIYRATTNPIPEAIITAVMLRIVVTIDLVAAGRIAR